jgi:hypothetical protein
LLREVFVVTRFQLAVVWYDLATMPRSKPLSLALQAMRALVVGPSAALAADSPAAAAPLTLTITRAVGAEAVIATGASGTAQTLEARFCICGHDRVVHDEQGCLAFVSGQERSQLRDCECVEFREAEEWQDFKSA